MLYRIPLPLLTIFQQYDSCQFYCKQSTLSHWISFCDKLDHVVFSSHGHRCNKQHAIHTISKFDQSFIIVWVIYICVFKKFSRSTNNICISILQYTVALSYKTTLLNATLFMRSDSKILLNCPLNRGQSSYKTFFFHSRRDNLIRVWLQSIQLQFDIMVPEKNNFLSFFIIKTLRTNCWCK